MRATKGNKTYSIDETQKKHYKEEGYDIVGDDGEVLEYGRGKTVPYETYSALKNEHFRLMAAYESLQGRYAELVNTEKPEPAAESEPVAEPEAPAEKKGKAKTEKAGE